MIKLIFSILFLMLTGSYASIGQDKGLIKVAKLGKEGNPGLAGIRKDFIKKNPGYDIFYLPSTQNVPSKAVTQVLFVQDGGGSATITAANGDKQTSKIAVGDIVLLEKGEIMEADSLLGLLAFTVPDKPDSNIPAFIRPDWDMNITDTPGGCATETNAYRRILLTWHKDVGNYIWHSINAHRVRIMDSFSHFHPEDQGFDEFYLVQMVMPGAKLFTSENVEQISDPESIKQEELEGLIQEHRLEVGDLVYLPRGVMHRGFGGILAQVITVPGFIPGSEIGVDHFLRQINERLGLRGKEALPFNRQASAFQVIR
ncbi:hypothetical protein [Negadavirga shengliensis]|uniref:JmjC domain-containing protein n=1 Tax=Negadavirga shengliensis TaxID=1389218 RepID=A0ABV9T1Q9_9BACT